MGWDLKTRAESVAAVPIAALLLASGALAAPPQARLLQAPTPHLDLRAPSHIPEPSGNVAEKSADGFPSIAHRQNLAQQNHGQQEGVGLPGLASDDIHIHARPTIQDFVLRVHREGLPVARLFETKSALLHLGLNPKGKPGLWLVQKTH